MQRKLFPFLVVLAVCAPLGFSAPTIAAGGVVGAARYLPEWHPQSGIAQGSIFVIFGQELGPASLVVVNEFPVPTELAGTQVQVVAGGVTLECPVIYTSAGQAAAIMPSNTPLGEANVFVRYGGAVSNAAPVRVVQRAPGFFTLSQNGRGPAVVTDLDYAVNTAFTSFAPGTVVSFWATGLGPRSRDDIAQVEDLRSSMDLQVLIGDRPAEVIYAGPSGCCAGLDQVIVKIPDQTEDHCLVPVVMTVDRRPSNIPTISVSADGGACQIPPVLAEEEVEGMQENTSAPFGVLDIIWSAVAGGGEQTGQSHEPGEPKEAAAGRVRPATIRPSVVALVQLIVDDPLPSEASRKKVPEKLLSEFDCFMWENIARSEYNTPSYPLLPSLSRGCRVEPFLSSVVTVTPKACRDLEYTDIFINEETKPEISFGPVTATLELQEGSSPSLYGNVFNVDPKEGANSVAVLGMYDKKAKQCLCASIHTDREAGMVESLGDDASFVASVLEAVEPRLKAAEEEGRGYRDRLRAVNGMRIEGLEPDDAVHVFGSVVQKADGDAEYGTAFLCTFSGDAEIRIPDYVVGNMLDGGSRKVIGIEVQTPVREQGSLRAVDPEGNDVPVGVDIRVKARYVLVEGQ